MRPFNRFKKSQAVHPGIQVDSSRFSQNPNFVIPYDPISEWMMQETIAIEQQLKIIDADTNGGDLDSINYIGKLANTAYLAGRKDVLNSLATVVLKSLTTEEQGNPSH